MRRGASGRLAMTETTSEAVIGVTQTSSMGTRTFIVGLVVILSSFCTRTNEAEPDHELCRSGLRGKISLVTKPQCSSKLGSIGCDDAIEDATRSRPVTYRKVGPSCELLNRRCRRRDDSRAVDRRVNELGRQLESAGRGRRIHG